MLVIAIKTGGVRQNVRRTLSNAHSQTVWTEVKIELICYIWYINLLNQFYVSCKPWPPIRYILINRCALKAMSQFIILTNRPTEN